MKRPHLATIAVPTALVLICLTVSCFFFQLSLINGNSMSPEYKNMQFVLLDKRQHDVQRGDVIAFRREGIGLLVKRVAAAPGDRVLISDGVLYINGEAQEQEERIEYSGTASSELLLGEGEYFVLGDNYGESRDSRFEEIGFVARGEIVGYVIPQK